MASKTQQIHCSLTSDGKRDAEVDKGTLMNEELGPLLVAPPQYLDVRTRIRGAVGFPNERRPILIGIDGFDGSGKSSLAAWLSWQLEMPAIHLDLYMVRDTDPVEFRTDHLAAAVYARLRTERPLIVEGILLLDVLASVGRLPNFLVYVEKEGNRPSSTLSSHVGPYIARRQPRERANYVLEWSSAEHDARVARAHLNTAE
jgi:hypothetical protein